MTQVFNITQVKVARNKNEPSHVNCVYKCSRSNKLLFLQILSWEINNANCLDKINIDDARRTFLHWTEAAKLDLYRL